MCGVLSRCRSKQGQGQGRSFGVLPWARVVLWRGDPLSQTQRWVCHGPLHAVSQAKLSNRDGRGAWVERVRGRTCPVFSERRADARMRGGDQDGKRWEEPGTQLSFWRRETSEGGPKFSERSFAGPKNITRGRLMTVSLPDGDRLSSVAAPALVDGRGWRGQQAPIFPREPPWWAHLSPVADGKAELFPAPWNNSIAPPGRIDNAELENQEV